MAQENPSIKRFQKYLQINTMHPNPDYAPAFEFLRKEAEDLEMEFQIVEIEGEHPNGALAIMTWKGTKPEMKSILLSSHVDVVPVFPEHWIYDPFSAHRDEQGNIYARGAQDMKCVTIWYLEAIRKLKSEGKRFARTIHLFFTTDEEIGNPHLKTFCENIQDFNIAFGLDEGIANPGEKMRVFYGERSILWLEVVCGGMPGHASQFLDNTAGPKLQYMINKFYELRDEQEKKLKENPDTQLGSVTTVNMSVLKGGVQPNVVPAEFRAAFDVRLPPTQDLVAFQDMLNQWAAEAGTDVKINTLHIAHAPEMVKLDDSNKYWMAFKGACESLKIEIQTEIFPASTDSVKYRKVGIDMLGFSPLNKTPILLHDHNEYLNEKVFLRGIDIYYKIISSLASVED